MPTPHGDQGMAFSAHEVRVLRRALTVALRGGRDSVDFWLLGRAIGEAHDERERLRAFMTAELRRYRAALPGSAATFLSCLRNAVDEIAHVPSAEDLAALRTVVDLPCGPHERASRAALLRRCTHLAEAALEQRLTARAHRRAAAEADRAIRPDPLDILIPGRTHPTPADSPPRPATTGRTGRVHREEPPRPLPEPQPADTATTEPEAIEPQVAACEVVESGVVELEAVDSGAVDCTAVASESPEPAVAPEDAALRPTPVTPEPSTTKAPTPESSTDPAPAGEEPEPTPAPGPETPPRETLSPVIPHRRQGRILGQLPAPEVLQTGTG
ncbi:hypothetical protein [Embleya sp. NPDC020630]|uniref:hypothetical protein n=1 Tax=Embleya sp. NPDC020630 TaxID=3363979 RepID=UPI0037AA4156